MERVSVLARLSLWALLVLLLQHGAHGARMLSAHVQGELPRCKFHWQVPDWDCFDAPQKPLPPCDFKHHSPGIDCWPGDPPAAAAANDESYAASTKFPVAAISGSTKSAHARQWPELPPCNLPGAMPGWDCYDPPTQDLPACDFKHQRPGIDCWPRSPPAAQVTVTEISAAGGASDSSHDQSITSQSGHHVDGMLPSCNDVLGGIPGWDCYDPPLKPLPPCDFKHQRAGFDCWPRDPSAAAP